MTDWMRKYQRVCARCLKFDKYSRAREREEAYRAAWEALYGT